MKIVFWGTPTYAAKNLTALIKTGYDIIAVVSQPDRKRGRGKTLSPSPVKKVALDFGIPVYTTHSITKDVETKQILFNLHADVYIVVAFGQILPKEILEQPTLGSWNSHASLLPLWRGAAPIQWSIINDDKETGVCIMSMEQGLDTGPVIERESIKISDADNLVFLTNRLSDLSSKLLIKSLERLKLTKGLSESERLKKLNAIEQLNFKGNTSYARQIKKDDYLINWNESARNIMKKIHGLYPNAYTLYKGKRIKSFQVCLINDYTSLHDSDIIKYKSKTDMKPGEIIMINKHDGIFIMTADNPLLIKSAQLEGKKPTDAYTLSIQTSLKKYGIFGV